MSDQREMKQAGDFKLLPPPPDLCQVCAADHEPGEPHDQQSLYYKFVFHLEHGRVPTWADAMAHCTDEVKDVWTTGLTKFGVVVEQASSKEASNGQAN